MFGANREFLGRIHEQRNTKLSGHMVWEGASGYWQCRMDVILNRPFFHKNDILKQKRTDACE
jgi:hypothetical protein